MTNKTTSSEPYIAVAPMMDWTDRHCRHFHRLLSPNAMLFTEMITTPALLRGDTERYLRFNDTEHPVALQLGGEDPHALAKCAKMAEDYGYDEINLNCGCPSDRVQTANIGACLMGQPDLVARGIEAMAKAVKIPVTVKCRIGIDKEAGFSFLNNFIEIISNAGCKEFTVHARQAWLKGLNPAENRDIPPLNYDIVKQIKEAHPSLRIILNGGIKDLETINDNNPFFDGFMIGREAYQNPFFLTDIEKHVFGNENTATREDVARAMIPYIEKQQSEYGTPVKSITRHMIGLFKGYHGGKRWRQYLSENAHGEDVTANVVEEALKAIG